MNSGFNFDSSSIKKGDLMPVGWMTGICFEVANSFTGVADILCPLPFGLSGWEMTVITSSPDSIRALREGTAKSGVPKKIILIICLIYYFVDLRDFL